MLLYFIFIFAFRPAQHFFLGYLPKFHAILVFILEIGAVLVNNCRSLITIFKNVIDFFVKLSF